MVTAVECVIEAEVAFTVIVYCPVGVPEEPTWSLLPLPPPQAVHTPTRSSAAKRAAMMTFFLLDWYVIRIPITARPKIGNHSTYSGDDPCGRIGRTRDAVGPVVATDNAAVTVPLAVGVREVGFNEQVGASAGAGDTEQPSETGASKPYFAVAVSVNTAELPATMVAFPGLALTPKSVTT